MSAPAASRSPMNMTLIKGLTYVMFAMFAMTTDSVGIIIPQIIKTFKLSLTAAGTFQYATMGGHRHRPAFSLVIWRTATDGKRRSSPA